MVKREDFRRDVYKRQLPFSTSRALDLPYHLRSFPYIFEYGGDTGMVPETCGGSNHRIVEVQASFPRNGSCIARS